MARYTGPTTRINRRFGEAIFSPNKAFERKNYLPGQHGPRLRLKPSAYGDALREKQKLRYLYGLLEKQFRLLFKEAKRLPGVTGDNFLTLLDLRLDNVVYMLGFAKSRAEARQFVTHGHICVGGKRVNIPSYRCKADEVIDVRGKTSSKQLATKNMEQSQGRSVPAWLSVDFESLKGIVLRKPAREELTDMVNIQLIVEFYSR